MLDTSSPARDVAPRLTLPRSHELSPLGFADALIQGERAACTRIVKELLEQGQPVLALYEDYFKPALYTVGALWERNQLSVAREHLATAIIEGLMNELFPELMSLDRRGRTIVLAPVEGEQHQVGGRMVCDLFEMHGWDAVQLETGTTAEDLVALLRTSQADLLGLSMSVSFHIVSLRRTIMAVRAAFPLLPILVGGQGLTRKESEGIERFPGVAYCRDLFELIRYLARMTGGR